MCSVGKSNGMVWKACALEGVYSRPEQRISADLLRLLLPRLRLCTAPSWARDFLLHLLREEAVEFEHPVF